MKLAIATTALLLALPNAALGFVQPSTSTSTSNNNKNGKANFIFPSFPPIPRIGDIGIGNGNGIGPSSASATTTALQAVPTLNNWSVTFMGEATGVVLNHPDARIKDGERLTTSKLKNQRMLKEGSMIVTASGSRYKLGTPKGGSGPPPASAAAPNAPRRSQSRGIAWRNGFTANKKVATVNDWSFTFRGELTGSAQNHPSRDILDGDKVTTSKILENKNNLKAGDTVTTASGSKYILGTKQGSASKSGGGSFFSGIGGLGGGSSSPPAESMGGTFKSDAAKKSANSSSESSSSSSGGTFRLLNKQFTDAMSGFGIGGGSSSSSSSTNNQASPATPTPTAAVNSRQKIAQEAEKIARLRDLKLTYGVNGKTVGNGKYLLCDKPQRSTSGKSNIWQAYRADEDGMPYGEKLTIKVSNNYDAIRREDYNYNRVCSGLFPGRFVEKSEFLENTDGFPTAEFKSSCALVIESGRKDLKAILSERECRGFEGRAMRDAASASLQCIQAMHSSGIVWTDLKTENFVIVSDEIGDNGNLPGVKGIDLESAMPKGSNPVDFSPEACPPEFAAAFIAGEGLDFRLEYSYDVWSYGMMLYELTTGRSYFENKTPAQITKSLQYGVFEADVSAVTDDKLRNLIEECLQTDPRKRPGVPQLLLHPYFLSSGLGPFGWGS